MKAEAQKLALIQMILSLQDSQLLNKIEQLLKSNGMKPNGVAEPDSSYPVKKRKAGFAKGMTLYIAPDFDETPPGFEEYMPESQ